MKTCIQCNGELEENKLGRIFLYYCDYSSCPIFGVYQKGVEDDEM